MELLAGALCSEFEGRAEESVDRCVGATPSMVSLNYGMMHLAFPDQDGIGNYAPTPKTSTVADIRAWVQTHGGNRTIMEIRDGLSEKTANNDIYTFSHPEGGRAFMIMDVSKEFYENLKAFIREPDVQVKHSMLHAMIVDPVIYKSSPGMHYMPVTLRINKRAPKPAKRPRTQANHGSASLIAGMGIK